MVSFPASLAFVAKQSNKCALSYIFSSKQLLKSAAYFLPALNFLTLLTLHKKQFLSHICSKVYSTFMYVRNILKCLINRNIISTWMKKIVCIANAIV